MDVTLSENFVRMIRAKKYKDFTFLNKLPDLLKERGIELIIRTSGKGATNFKFFHKLKDGNEVDITSIVEEFIEETQGYHPQSIEVPEL